MRQSPDEPLSIGVVTGSVSRRAGGLFNSVRRSAIALADTGQKVGVLGLEDAWTQEDIVSWRPIVPLAHRTIPPSQFGLAPALGKSLSAGNFDILHQHGIWQGYSAQVSRWRRQTDHPVIISPRGMLDRWAIANSAWKKRIARRLFEDANLSGASCLHALNEDEAAAFREYGLKSPIAVIPNGADLPAARAPEPPAWWPRGRILLFIGRIHPKKGLAELIEAFARWSVDDPKHGWHCVIAGWDDGGHLANLEAKAAQLSLGDRLHFPGPLYGADKGAAMRHADAFILPSFSEGLPMSILEAWAYGLPVMMTRECNLPEGFSKGAAVEIATDPQRLAATLSDVLNADSIEVLKCMGERGLALVERRFSWTQIASDQLAVYRWLTRRSDDVPSCVQFA